MHLSIGSAVVASSLMPIWVVCRLGVPAVGAEQSSATEAPPAQQAANNWEVDDLDGDLDRVKENRSFEAGKSAFEKALCATCHSMNNQDGSLGPDLSKPPEKGKREGIDLLRSILQPSKDVDEKYQAYLIVTERGAVIAGIITERGEDTIRVRTRPVGSEIEKVIPREQISEMMKLSTSMMPDGLLNTLSKEQILDLMAYIEARGDRKDPRFK